MKQNKWLAIILMSAVLVSACGSSVGTLPIPTFTSTARIFTPIPTYTALPPTPTLILIRADTVFLLEITSNFYMGEYVRTVAFTPDGKFFAAAGGNTEDFSIYIGKVETGEIVNTFGGHNGIVWNVAFSPDGQLLASVSSDGTAQIRDWRTGEVIKILNFPGQPVSVSFSPDGQSLAVGGTDEPQGQILNASIWTYSTGSWNPQLKLSEYWNIAALAYSPDGSRIIGGGTSRNVQVWSTSDGTSLYTLYHAHQVLDAAISPDGSTLATATCYTTDNYDCPEGGVWLWDLRTGKLLQKLRRLPNFVESIAYTVDGSMLFAASRDGTIRAFNTSNYEAVYELTPQGGNGTLALSPDGTLLASGGANGQVFIWQVIYRP